MRSLPIFFEATPRLESPRLHVVNLVRAELYKHGFLTLPFARKPLELKQVLENVKAAGDRPGLFIVNTLGAEEWLDGLDAMIKDTPAVFFRHKQLWLQESEALMETAYGVTTRIGKLRPRLTVTRRYGPLNSAQIARAVSIQLAAFLRFGDFRSLEGQMKVETGGFYGSHTA